MGRRRRHVFRRRRETAQHQGTGSEDYFWERGVLATNLLPMAIRRAGKGEEVAGSRTSVYRFHLDSPIPFTKSFGPPLSTGMPITGRIIISRWPIGTRRNPTLRFPRCHPWMSGFPGFIPWVGRGMQPNEEGRPEMIGSLLHIGPLGYGRFAAGGFRIPKI